MLLPLIFRDLLGRKVHDAGIRREAKDDHRPIVRCTSPATCPGRLQSRSSNTLWVGTLGYSQIRVVHAVASHCPETLHSIFYLHARRLHIGFYLRSAGTLYLPRGQYMRARLTRSACNPAHEASNCEIEPEYIPRYAEGGKRYGGPSDRSRTVRKRLSECKYGRRRRVERKAWCVVKACQGLREGSIAEVTESASVWNDDDHTNVVTEKRGVLPSGLLMKRKQ